MTVAEKTARALPPQQAISSTSSSASSSASSSYLTCSIDTHSSAMNSVDEHEHEHAAFHSDPHQHRSAGNSECALPNNHNGDHQKETGNKDIKLRSSTRSSSQSTASVRKSVNFKDAPSVQSKDGGAPVRRRLSRQPFSKLRSEVNFKQQKHIPTKNKPLGVILPWDRRYKAWWGFSVFWSIMTVFFETYQIAFAETGFDETGLTKDGAFIIGYIFVAVFSLDMVLNFNLAYFDVNDNVVTDRKKIAHKYLKCMFWVDLMGVFPFYNVAVAVAGPKEAQNSDFLSLLRLLRLFRLVRLHRVKQLFDALQFNTKVSLMTLTLVRNFGTALVWTHFSACVMYYISKNYQFAAGSTWIGDDWESLDPFERYLASLYWSVVTFTTVGYGDYSPANAAERIWGVTYMLLNMVLSAWMIGSITLLIVKTDEQTGVYRDTLKTLDLYSQTHTFDVSLNKRLRSQMKLYFSYRQLSDEEVLKNFPTLTRRKVLKQLYLPSIIDTSLMKGVREQFIDAFLCCCRVEIFSPGDELLQRGANSTELYLLVEGNVNLITPMYNNEEGSKFMDSSSSDDGFNYNTAKVSSSDDMANNNGNNTSGGYYMKTLGPGHFINDISFFTATPMMETVQTGTICKALTLPMAEFKLISDDHPGSVSQILQNLLLKIEDMDSSLQHLEFVPVRVEGSATPSPPKAGGLFVDRNTSGYRAAARLAIRDDPENDDDNDQDNYEPNQYGVQIPPVDARALKERQRLVQGQIDKLKEDQVARLLFAASRGDTTTISAMCDHGFDVNSVDYDNRTALMVASAKGCTEAVRKLFSYHASPNMKDGNGFTALYEAARNGHDSTVAAIMEAGGKLLMSSEKAAIALSQAVLDGGQNGTLRRLLKAGIHVNACGYDKRAAVHAAAISGNLEALKLLVEFGADITVKDLWGNSVYDDAKKSKSEQVIQYVYSLDSGKSGWFN